MDFVEGLDPSKLTLGLTTLSFLISPFSAPVYNLPIFLFGTLAQQQEGSDPQALQTFTGLLGASAVFDIVWLVGDHHGLVKFLLFVLFILKIPTFVVLSLALRQRGAQFSGLGIRGGDLGGATVWDSMPGGFSVGNNGYQNVDEPAQRSAQYSRQAAPPSMPVPQPTAQAPAAPPAVAGYQTV
ncbi:hypothetical protein B0H15DRAFT_1017227 [Mycena belliarum]|uniref:Uncharacterized protein n=1 Tax=Mycena belliarum TaxID=1033014 RepID=A0AAD6UIE3_9AGAR|nr:hypothetical protein B0H15DRAFT_1017227 [Mycena belliae]